MNIEIQNLSKEFGNHVALDNLNISIKEGSLCSLLGPSGCGKTTLLRIIAGIEQANSGKIIINGQENSPELQRSMGLVFQHYALFKHMTAFENVAFGLRVKDKKERLSNSEIEREVHEVLSLVQLDNQGHKYPHQLSGGQQQRIALARVLAIKPKVLLLDEPFGALDSTVRRDLRRWLRRLHDEIHITTILVTHDQEEALEISDQVILLNHGRLEQSGNPREIYTNPQTPFVYEFLGVVNIFSGRLKDHHLIHFSQEEKQEKYLDTDSLVYVRPHDVQISKTSNNANDLSGHIIRISFVATNVLLEIRLDSQEEHQKPLLIEVNISDEEWEEHKYAVGDEIYVRSTQFTLFETNTSANESANESTST